MHGPCPSDPCSCGPLLRVRSSSVLLHTSDDILSNFPHYGLLFVFLSTLQWRRQFWLNTQQLGTRSCGRPLGRSDILNIATLVSCPHTDGGGMSSVRFCHAFYVIIIYICFLPDAFLYRCLNNCFLFFIFSFLLQGVWSGVFLASSDSVTDMPGIYLVLEYIYADTHLSPLEETTRPDHRPWCHYQEYDLYSTWP